MSDDRAPEDQLGAGSQLASTSAVERMMAALRPLNVSRGEEVAEDLVVLERLGAGGMGTVELARQRSLGREVALKRLNDGSSDDASLAQMLVEEARVLGGLGHPNIVPVHAVGLDPVLGPVVVLERVQGEVWTEALERDRESMFEDPAVLELHLRVLMQVCNALHFAHSRRILHRDVKPDNVMLGAYGEVFLMDWGVALRLDDVGSTVQLAMAGTPVYMSPEMVRGDPNDMDARTDVYLVGATLHEVLTGDRRHRAPSLPATLVKALQSRPHEYGADVPRALAAIANRACAPEPGVRFESAAELRGVLADYLQEKEARTLLATASEILDEFEASDDATDESAATVERERRQTTHRFQEARFAIEHALRVRPGFAAGLREKRRCLLAGVRHAVLHGDLPRARMLAVELGEDLPGPVAAMLEAASARDEERRERAAALERDVDISVSYRERLRTVSLVLLAIVLAAMIELALEPGPGLDLDRGGLLLRGVVLAAIALVGVFVQRKRLMTTRLNRLMARGFSGVGVFLVVVRGIAYALELPVPVVFAVELAGIGLLMVVLDAPLPAAPYFGFLGLGFAALGGWQPTWARYLHMAFTIGLMAVAVWDIRDEGRRIREAEAEEAASRVSRP